MATINGKVCNQKTGVGQVFPILQTDEIVFTPGLIDFASESMVITAPRTEVDATDGNITLSLRQASGLAPGTEHTISRIDTSDNEVQLLDYDDNLIYTFVGFESSITVWLGLSGEWRKV